MTNLRQQEGYKDFPIAGMVGWSNEKNMDKANLEKLMKRIAKNEGILSPLRRHRKYMCQLICGLFINPMFAYEKMHRHYIEGDYIAGNAFSSYVNLALIKRMFEGQNKGKDEKTVITAYQQLKKVYPLLVDGQIKPYLLLDDFKELDIRTVRAYMDDFKHLNFMVCKGLLWLSLYLTSCSEKIDVFKVNALRDEIDTLGVTVSPGDYILLGYIAGTIETPKKALDYCQKVLPRLLGEEQVKGLGEELLLFFAFNHYRLKEGYLVEKEDKYEYTLVLNQLVTNNTSIQDAVNVL